MSYVVSPEIKPELSTITQSEENAIFDRMLEKYGAYELETKIQKLDSCRRYYRRYPYDGWLKREGIEAVDVPVNTNLQAEIIAKEAREELLNGLTERELQIATLSEEGYKPGDIAALAGKTQSGAERWIKWSVRRKMENKLSTTARSA